MAANKVQSGQVDEVKDLKAEISRLRGRFELFTRLSVQVAASLDPTTVLQDIVDAACELTSARYGALGVFDEAGGILQFLTHGVTEGERERIGDLPRGRGLLGWLHRLQKPARLAGISQHPESSGFPPNHPLMKTFLGAPVRYADEPLGNLYLTSKENDEEFTSDDEDLLVLFAAQAAMAIRNARQFTSLRQSEQRFEGLAAAAPVGIFRTDVAGKCIYVNDRWCEIAGLSPDEAMGDGWMSTLHPEDRDRVSAEWDECALEGKVFRSEYRFLRPDGVSSWVYGQAVSESGEDRASGFVGTTTDITARLEVEQLKADFLSMVTHDLRGPLSTIKGLSSTMLIQEAPTDAATTLEYLTSIDEEADRMVELVANLLDMSRIEARSMPLEPEVCHLADITAECVRHIERSRAGGGQRIVTDVPLDLPSIFADYDQIFRVLTNLLSNAIKYSPEGSDVLVRSRMHPEDEGIILTEVVDRGIGVPDADKDKIFDKFYRVTSQRGRGRPGSGLGLAICKAIVEAHSGELWFVSEVGKGSTFSFTLPIGRPEDR
ncbi:MAG: ATP-binding protein [Chloroflexi bacterium]|nr:ATP-binding protein [Chloroflexota bacterium]